MSDTAAGTVKEWSVIVSADILPLAPIDQPDRSESRSVDRTIDTESKESGADTMLDTSTLHMWVSPANTSGYPVLGSATVSRESVMSIAIYEALILDVDRMRLAVWDTVIAGSVNRRVAVVVIAALME